MARLYTENLIKQYNGRRVVNEVSIEVRKGEIVGLLGPNGAGKSTTFNMIVGLLKPDGGQVLLDGRDLSGMPVHQRARNGIGYLAQDTSIFRKLTVEENIRAIAELMPALSPQQQDEKVALLIRELGIGKVAHSPAYTLSGGERRRTEIARALVPDPLFMLLDEPFTGIDPIAIEEIQDIIVQLQQRGLGVLITDHRVLETLTITTRAYIIHEGRVLFSGTSQELINDPRARQLYLGERFAMPRAD